VEIRAIVIGGLIPSLMLGLGSVLMKLSVRAGISLPLYLVLVGLTVFSFGGLAALFTGERFATPLAIGFAVAMGTAWSTGVFCMAYGFSVLKLPVSVIAPMTNSNALVAVLVSAVVFSEWRELNAMKVITGTLLIVLGATVVSTAMQK
jgi:transporter family protein